MSTRARVTLVAAGFLILLTLTLVLLWLVQQGRYLRAEQTRRVYVVTNLMAEISQESLAEGNVIRLARVADTTVASAAVSRIIVADLTGTVLVDSMHAAYGAKPRITLRALRLHRTIIVTRPSHWWGASAVRNEQGQALGAVMVEYPTQALISAQRRTRAIGLLLVLLGVLLGSALAYFAAVIITRPLEQLLAGIRQLQAGAVTEPVPESGGPELAEIGRAFNEMSDAVRARVTRLELLNEMATSLPLATDLQGIATILRRYARPMLNARAYLWTADPLSRQLTLIPAEEGEAEGEPVLASSATPVARAFVERRMLIAGSGGELPANTSIAPGIRVRSAIVMPLMTYEGVAGVLSLVFPMGRWITEEDKAVASAIANMAAPIALSTLRMEAQSRAAATLQALLVPEEMPDIGLDLAAVYVPAEEIAGLGGDYYDIVSLGPARWSIIVGDTSGKGLEAARNTATAKYVIRSYILEYGNPAETLLWSNRALVIQEQAGRFITVFCSAIDTRTGVLTYANGGHVSPLWYHRSSGNIEYLGGQSLALGVVTDASYSDSTIQLQPGDIFCAYTDGITEARRGSEWFGDDRLPEVVAATADLPAGQITDAILQAVREFTGDRLRDDVVLVVLKMS